MPIYTIKGKRKVRRTKTENQLDSYTNISFTLQRTQSPDISFKVTEWWPQNTPPLRCAAPLSSKQSTYLPGGKNPQKARGLLEFTLFKSS